MTTYKSGSQETVFDVVLGRYGNMDNLATLLKDNPDLLLGDGTIDQFRVEHDLSAVAPSEAAELQKVDLPDSGGTEQVPVYKSTSTQNVFDVALMQYGDVGGLGILLAQNKDLLQETGTMNQFRVAHAIDTNLAVDARMKRKMLALVPCTEGAQNDAWIADDGSHWIADDGQSWITDNN